MIQCRRHSGDMSIRNALKNGTATLEFGAASSANTTFAADAAGTLQLDNSFEFSGIVLNSTATIAWISRISSSATSCR